MLHTTQTEACKLAVQDIHKRYGDNEVLKGVSLNANKGDVISIIGSSGSGKSTFLRCINFLERPNAGRSSSTAKRCGPKPIAAATCEVADHKQLQRMRTKLAMVFQHFNLWAHMNVMENIIEAPIHVLACRAAKPKSAPASIWRRSVWRHGWNSNIRRIFPAASSSAWRLPARWRWSRT